MNDRIRLDDLQDEVSYPQQLSAEQGQALTRVCTAREEQRARAQQAEADHARVQERACRLAELLRKAEARVAELEVERKKDAAINAQVDAQTEEQLNGATEVAQYYKALAERTQAWGEQHRDRANRYRTRADAVRSELAALNSETAGLNPYAMAGRRDAVARIRAALQAISYDTPVPDDPRVTALEAENARLRAAWTSARGRVKRAKRNRDGELRWANNMLSAALDDLHRYRQAWKSARRRAVRRQAIANGEPG